MLEASSNIVDLEDRLDAMEGHIKDCDTDRKELRNMLLHHLGAVVKVSTPILP